MKQECGK